MVSDDVASHRVRLMGIVTSASDSSELDSQSIAKVYAWQSEEVECIQLTLRCQKHLLSCLLSLLTITPQVNLEHWLSKSIVFSIYTLIPSVKA